MRGFSNELHMKISPEVTLNFCLLQVFTVKCNIPVFKYVDNTTETSCAIIFSTNLPFV